MLVKRTPEYELLGGLGEMTIGIRTPRDWTTMVFFLKRAKLRRSQLFAYQTQIGHKFESLIILNAKSKRSGI